MYSGFVQPELGRCFDKMSTYLFSIYNLGIHQCGINCIKMYVRVFVIVYSVPTNTIRKSDIFFHFCRRL